MKLNLMSLDGWTFMAEDGYIRVYRSGTQVYRGNPGELSVIRGEIWEDGKRVYPKG